MKKTLRVTIELDCEMNQEYAYQAMTRIQHALYTVIDRNLLNSQHPEDAVVLDRRIEIGEENESTVVA